MYITIHYSCATTSKTNAQILMCDSFDIEGTSAEVTINYRALTLTTKFDLMHFILICSLTIALKIAHHVSSCSYKCYLTQVYIPLQHCTLPNTVVHLQQIGTSPGSIYHVYMAYKINATSKCTHRFSSWEVFKFYCGRSCFS